jgi:hypothetical protein
MARIRLQKKMELGHGEQGGETKEGNLSAVRHKRE